MKKGRIWAYVRDQRPWAGASPPPGAVYTFAPDWKEEHVQRHLANTCGILQGEEGLQTVRGTVCPTNGYKGYAKLYEPERDDPPRLREAACWAHLRRDFHDEWSKTKSAIAREALDRIGALYDIEREINGHPADIRLAARQKYSVPKVDAVFAWAESQLALIPGKGDLAQAFRYGLSAAPHSACSSKMVGWPSTTIRQNARSDRLESEEKLAIRRGRHRRGNPRAGNDGDRNGQDERPRSPSVSH